MNTTETITITPDQLVELIREHDKKGTSMISFSTMTDAKARKTGRDEDLVDADILKVSNIGGVIGYSYANAAAKEGFAPKERSWGVRVSRSLVEHKGQYYVSVMVKRSLTSPIYVIRKNGLLTMVPRAKIEHLLPPHRDNPIVVRDYSVDSIRQARMLGKRYLIKRAV